MHLELLTFDNIIQTLLIGIANGSVIALIAIGYTLVYGIIELINFAHGDLFMLGTFAALTVLDWTYIFPTANPPKGGINLGPLPAMLLALVIPMVMCALLNVSIERLAYRRLRNAPRLAPLISAIGVSFILINIGLYWRGPGPQAFPFFGNVFDPTVNLIGFIFGDRVTFGLKDMAVILVTIPLIIVLQWVVYRTKIGKAMRATAQDRETAALMGINVNQTIAFAFLLGGALAGAAGLVFGVYTGSSYFLRGFDAGLKAFTAAVLGGIGSIGGAALGGILIGIVAAFNDQIFDSTWTNAVIFAVLIIILVFRPTGLLGAQTTDKV